MADDSDERFYHGPYKLAYFEPWRGIFGTEALTDLQALNDDLERWKRLIEQGDGARAAAEISEVLVAFQQPSPVDKMLAGNRFYSYARSAGAELDREAPSTDEMKSD